MRLFISTIIPSILEVLINRVLRPNRDKTVDADEKIMIYRNLDSQNFEGS